MKILETITGILLFIIIVWCIFIVYQAIDPEMHNKIQQMRGLDN